MANVKCPFCGSEAIFRFRRDSDYGGGQYYETVNDDSCYEGVRNSIPDVDVFHCKGCYSFFNPDSIYPSINVIPVASVREAINNLEKHIQWLTGHYKKSCQSARLRIDKSTETDLATTLLRDGESLSKAHSEIEKFSEQVKLLSHIVEKHQVTIPTIFTDANVGEVDD